MIFIDNENNNNQNNITDMAIYLKKFENHTQYETYINGSGAILPNVSICTTEGDVHYNPSTPPTPVETRLVCKYNVEDTEYETQLCSDTTYFSAMEIDGVEQAEVVQYYQFDTLGEHIVKYTLTDPTTFSDDDVKTFNNCSGLTSIVIPNSVTSIGEYAFNGCESLTSCTIGSGVTSIGDNAFNGCESLQSINIPSGVTSIDIYTFSYCHSLTSCTMGNGVTYIGEGAFMNCNSLPSINIPSSVEEISVCAFYDCSSLDAASIAAIEAISPEALTCSG